MALSPSNFAYNLAALLSPKACLGFWNFKTHEFKANFFQQRLYFFFERILCDVGEKLQQPLTNFVDQLFRERMVLDFSHIMHPPVPKYNYVIM